ncbi:hypothetical protein OG762_05045 [Streptomyces sp. NBC_01136]|uniref:hypothetical protein n=1 Tax=Streptomyces sp. NBC_01136 TaxID=2903754 RepID=UPI0038709FE6|nr:hypothetical protein OG762_05045 [Streptomyces sp. NBC_01136]
MIAADRRAYLHLAERPDIAPESAAFFAMLAEGEALARTGWVRRPRPTGCTSHERRRTSRCRRTVERLFGAQAFGGERRGILARWPGGPVAR